MGPLCHMACVWLNTKGQMRVCCSGDPERTLPALVSRVWLHPCIWVLLSSSTGCAPSAAACPSAVAAVLQRLIGVVFYEG